MRTKFLTAPGQGFRSAREVQALAGLSDVYAVYQAVARGKPVGGEAWRWADEDELPTELRYGTRNRYVTDDPAAAKAADDENGDGHHGNGDDAEPPSPVSAAMPKSGTWGLAKRLLVCRCAACAGRVWRPRDVHRLPEIGGRVVRPDTLPGINRLTGHAFEYLETAPVGEWRKRTAAERNDAPHAAAAPPPMTPAERRAAHVFACDPAARELQQVNPLGPGPDRANGGSGVR